MARRRLTEDERKERRARDREQLKVAAGELLCSDGWQRWVGVRARNGLSRYSLSNQLLIALSCPKASFVAGFKAWLELGYCVRKGEKAIRIHAPMPVKERDRVTGEESGETVTLFKVVFVFDRSQVDPVPSREHVPLEPPCEPLAGDSHVHLLAPMGAFAESLGYSVSFEAIEGSAGGFCDIKGKRIVVEATLPANGKLRTLIHETAHALGVDYERYSRAQAEVIVDTVTFVAASSVGLAVHGESIPYVAGWGEDGELEAVTEFAGTIDSLARRIEDVLDAADREREAGAAVA